MEDNNNNNDHRVARQLAILRDRLPTYFSLNSASLESGLWTPSHAAILVEALKACKSVEHVNFGYFQYTSSNAALYPFMDYVQSNPRLTQVSIQPSMLISNRDDVQVQIDSIFRAILQNPSIKTVLTCRFGSPNAIFDLLSKTKTISSFLYLNQAGYQMTREHASAVAAGLARNPFSIKAVELHDMDRDDPLPIILRGIGGGVESLTISQRRPPEELGTAVAGVLDTTPSLKTLKLEVTFNDHDDFGGHSKWIDPVFRALRHAPCADLEKVVLDGVWLDQGQCGIDKKYILFSGQTVNHDLQVLDLRRVHFADWKSVSLFWFFVGLKELYLCDPKFRDDDHDPDYLTELIRRNPNMETVAILPEEFRENLPADENVTPEGIHQNMGIVNGARGHPSIQNVRLAQCKLDQHDGIQVCDLLRDTKGLKKLTFERVVFGAHCTSLLATQGVAQSGSIQHIGFRYCRGFELDVFALESLFRHLVLKVVDLEGSQIHVVETETETRTMTICKALSNSLATTISLEHFCFPEMTINAANMAILVRGLIPSTTIKLVSFYGCTLDHDALDCLVQALVQEEPESPNPTTTTSLTVSTIKLPAITEGERIKPFLRHLRDMPYIAVVETPDQLDEDEESLLLKVVKGKKNLRTFTRKNYRDSRANFEIDFYLKLNRLGRKYAETPNAIPTPRMWPFVLGRMSNSDDPHNLHALFYFVRMCATSVHQYEVERPQEQQQQQH